MRDGAERFDGRRVLVTGASRGIAAAIARGLGRVGAHVILNHSADSDAAVDQPHAAATIARRIEAEGGGCTILETDLSDPALATDLAERALDAGAVDGLVLSASMQLHATFLHQTPDMIARQLAINLQSNIALLQRLLPGMIESGFGRVLAIGSVQELAPSPEMPIYAMSKAALKNLMENLAIQHAADGVTFNTLSPGLIQTDRNAFRRVDAEVWARTAAGANPMGRAGQPDEMIDPSLYLLSRGAAFVTGATLYATGGGHIAAPRFPPAKAGPGPDGWWRAAE